MKSKFGDLCLDLSTLSEEGLKRAQERWVRSGEGRIRDPGFVQFFRVYDATVKMSGNEGLIFCRDVCPSR
jgi:hypothetical protein